MRYLPIIALILVLVSIVPLLFGNLDSLALIKLVMQNDSQPHPLMWLAYDPGKEAHCIEIEKASMFPPSLNYQSDNSRLLGIVYIQQGLCWDMAERAFADVLLLDLDNKTVRYWLGLSQYAQGDYVTALSNWSEANAGQIFVGTARYLQQVGYSGESLGWYEIAVAVGQQSAESPARTRTLGLAYWDMAEIAQHEGRFRDAAIDYEQAVEFLPDDARLRHRLANFYISQGGYEQAIIHMEEAALRIQPDSPALLGALGEVYLQTGYLVEAEQSFLASLSAIGPYPDQNDYWHIRSWFGLGRVYYQRQELENSVAAIFRGIELEGGITPLRKQWLSQVFDDVLLAFPHRLDLFLDIGDLYVAAGELDTAMSYYEQAAINWPNHPEIQWRLRQYGGDAQIAP